MPSYACELTERLWGDFSPDGRRWPIETSGQVQLELSIRLPFVPVAGMTLSMDCLPRAARAFFHRIDRVTWNEGGKHFSMSMQKDYDVDFETFRHYLVAGWKPTLLGSSRSGAGPYHGVETEACLAKWKELNNEKLHVVMYGKGLFIIDDANLLAVMLAKLKFEMLHTTLTNEQLRDMENRLALVTSIGDE